MTSEGVDRWVYFTLVNSDDFANIAKSVSSHITPFTIGVFKLKCLNTLKL